ncbi:hypothetical protein SNEBB_005534 [Seison nebaliae]|nr:hypothetical protein SNEBB_005534 [Seison nebaliae]
MQLIRSEIFLLLVREVILLTNANTHKSANIKFLGELSYNSDPLINKEFGVGIFQHSSFRVAFDHHILYQHFLKSNYEPSILLNNRKNVARHRKEVPVLCNETIRERRIPPPKTEHTNKYIRNNLLQDYIDFEYEPPSNDRKKRDNELRKKLNIHAYLTTGNDRYQSYDTIKIKCQRLCQNFANRSKHVIYSYLLPQMRIHLLGKILLFSIDISSM